MNDTKYEIPDDLKAAWDVLPQNCWERQLIQRIGELLSENKRLVEELADERLAFEHANEACGKYEADVARLSAPVSDEEMNIFALHRIDVVEPDRRLPVLTIFQANALLAARQSAKEPPTHE